MRRSLVVPGLLAVVLSLAIGHPVVADDTGMPPDEGLLGKLELGTCQGLGWRDDDGKYVVRTPTEPQFPDGAVLRLSVVDITQPPNARLELTIADDEIVLPDDWRVRPDQGEGVSSFPDGWRFRYEVTGLEEGDGEGIVVWGVSVDGGPASPYPSRLMVAVSPPCPDAYPDAYATPPATDTTLGSRPVGRTEPESALLLLSLVVGVVGAMAASRRPAARR